MSKFFPSGIRLDDNHTPKEILQDAVRDWETESMGQLTLVLQPGNAQDGDEMILVHGKHVPSNRTISLFSVVSRSGSPYPTRIQPRNDEMPIFYKKSYYKPGIADDIDFDLQGRNVTNKWVAETPAEFREKLVDAFNLGTIKTELLNLICDVSPADGETLTGISQRPTITEAEGEKG